MNLLMIRSMEEEKVKRLCGVEDIGEIFEQGLGVNCDNLQLMEGEIETEIAKYEQENALLKANVMEGCTK